MQLQQLLDEVEHPAGNACLRIAGDLLDLAVGHDVDVELRPHPLEQLGELQGRHFGGAALLQGRRQRAEHRRIVARAQDKAFVDDHGGEVGIEHDRAERILDAADKHRFVNERIKRSAQPAPLRAQARPALRRCAGDDQGLEIGPVRLALAERGRQYVRHALPEIPMNVPVLRVLAERAREQRDRDPLGKRCRAPRIFSRGSVAQCSH